MNTVGIRCCYCFPIRTGVLVLGVLHLLNGLVTFIGGLVTGTSGNYYANTQTMFLSYAVEGAISVALASSLLYGVVKNKLICVTIYYLWCWFSIGTSIGVIIWVFVEYADSPMMYFAAYMIVRVLINLYFTVVIGRYRILMMISPHAVFGRPVNYPRIGAYPQPGQPQPGVLVQSGGYPQPAHCVQLGVYQQPELLYSHSGVNGQPGVYGQPIQYGQPMSYGPPMGMPPYQMGVQPQPIGTQPAPIGSQLAPIGTQLPAMSYFDPPPGYTPTTSPSCPSSKRH